MSARHFLSLLALIALHTAHAEIVTLPDNPGSAFATPVKVDAIDADVFAEWSDGKERKVERNRPEGILYTDAAPMGNAFQAFGGSKVPGARHLRIGFKAPVAAGTILVKNGGAVSVLKPDAPYPGDLNNEAHWTPAQRLEKGQPTTAEPSETNFNLWILPPGKTIRAMRFTHTAKATDAQYFGVVSGVMVIPGRLTNEAWNAIAGASANNVNARRINNGQHDDWDAWENQEKGKAPADAPVISAGHPEYVTLTWPQPVAINGLIALWAGIATADVQIYTANDSANPNDAPDSSWQTLNTCQGIKHNYPAQFWPNYINFGKEVKTRAIRLRITEAGASLIHANNNGGKRVWLGELMAVRNLGTEPLKAAAVATLPKPPIPIKFTLKEPGFVSLVIEKEDGFRVRNLVSETPYPAGENTAWWDGTDDLGRDADAADHGVYQIPIRYVEPGKYRVRGIVRGAIKPHYEFTVYTTGNPPWTTEDSTGAWLANHSPPQAAAFIPAAQSPSGADAVYLGCYVTEGPSGLAWVDLNGKKLGGKKWVGGNWTAAPFLARDAGPKAIPGVHVYVASTWEADKKAGIGELRITAVTRDGDKPVIKHSLPGLIFEGNDDTTYNQLGGVAVHNGVAVASFFKKNELLVIDAAAGKVLRTISIENPRGIAFDSKGNLLVLSKNKLVAFQGGAVSESPPAVVIASGLEDPQGITVDDKDNIYISDQGNSHQVKVFTGSGKFIRAIGTAGPPVAGKYDPLHMNHPHGIAVDSKQQLWVTEHDYMPKRVSVWSAEGKLVNAFYGPGKYGGGGSLDPKDKTKFYYADEGRGTLEFKLDWTKGTWDLERVLFRKDPHNLKLATGCAAPEQAIYHEGRRYFTNAYNSSPVGGTSPAYVFVERDGITHPAAGMGYANNWEILKAEAFRSRWPEGMDPKPNDEFVAFFIWSDLNEDAQVQPAEVTFQKGKGGGMTVMQDLSFCAARFDGKAVQFIPTGFTKSGIPLYDFTQTKILADNVQPPKSSGGNQVLTGGDGWSVVTLGIGPFDAMSICGAKDGVAKWSYPSLWPGLHASHNAPRPDRPGELIGTTRLPGGFFDLKTGFGPLWTIHTNHGRIGVFTHDGIFVANLFEDMRTGKSWKMPTAVRNTDLEGLSLGDENFWPTLTHASDGKVYLVDGAHSAIVRLDGFETLKRLPDTNLTLDKADIEKGRAWRTQSELARQKARGTGIMKATIRTDKPVIDGKLNDWTGADFVEIDKSGVKAWFDSNSKPYDITGAVAVSGDKLYAAWKTGAEQPLKNSGENPLAPFKTGDCLDLMIGPGGDRSAPVAGDQRLLVTLVKNKPLALLYRAVVPGTKESEKIPFASPTRSVSFDKVEDVSSLIEFSGNAGNYEVSIPINTLGIKPTVGAKIKGDIGILRGQGNETNARIYWSNKATGIVSDVPDEAMLVPALWGTLEFK